MSAPRSVDLLVTGTVVTLDPERRVLDDGAVAVAAGRIVAVGPRPEVTSVHDPSVRLGGRDTLVTPGFVNTHQHLTGDRLLRSAIPDDLGAADAIERWALPAHRAHTGDDDELTATLGLAEALTNGVTTTVEAGTVTHPDRVADAFEAVGARGALGGWGSDRDGMPHAGPPAEVLARQADTVRALGGRRLVDGWVTLIGHDLMSDELVAGAAELAASLGTRLTFHLSPSADDPSRYLARTGRRPLVHLDGLGVLGARTLVAHAVHVDDAEVEALAATDTAVAYCPWAYLRLGQGVTRAGRHVEMAARGIRVGLGCDAENAGDAVDMLRTAALAAGLAKDMAVDPAGFGAHDALVMATRGGAAAIGRADDLGSIEPGKQADLVLFDTRGLEWVPPAADPVPQLVWSSDGRSVRDVVVDGRVVVRNGAVVGLDLDAARSEARERRAALLARAGLSRRLGAS